MIKPSIILFGVTLPDTIPANKHIVADAGYAISKQVMMPYPVEEEMLPEDFWYNYLHSRTRIIVERAIGMVKNRFHIFKVPTRSLTILLAERKQKKWGGSSEHALSDTTS